MGGENLRNTLPKVIRNSKKVMHFYLEIWSDTLSEQNSFLEDFLSIS